MSVVDGQLVSLTHRWSITLPSLPRASLAPPNHRRLMSAMSAAAVESVARDGGSAVVPQSSMLRLRQLYQRFPQCHAVSSSLTSCATSCPLTT